MLIIRSNHFPYFFFNIICKNKEIVNIEIPQFEIVLDTLMTDIIMMKLSNTDIGIIRIF